MEKTNLFNKLKNKGWATFISIAALVGYWIFLFIPTGTGFTTLMPYVGSNVLQGTLMNQIIYICTHFNTAFTNLNLLHIATLSLIAFMLFVFVSTLISSFYGKKAVYKTNILHAGLAIGVVFFYIIAVVKESSITGITEFKQFFLNAEGKFTFLFPTYMPLMAAFALAVAIVNSISSVKAKSFFRFIILAVSCVSLAIFIFPIINKNGVDYNFVNFLFSYNSITTFNGFYKVIFVMLAAAVLINFILVVLYMGSNRFNALIVVFTGLYTIIAIIAIILVFVNGRFNVFTNATVYAAASAIAQAILIFTNSSLTKNSFKTQVDILTKKHRIAKQYDYMGVPTSYNEDEYNYAALLTPVPTEEDVAENTETTDVTVTDENSISNTEKRRREKAERKRKKQLAMQGNTDEDTDTADAEQTDTENKQTETLEQPTPIVVPVEEQTTATPVYTNVDEYYNDSLPSTDATVVRTTKDGLPDTSSAEYAQLKANRRNSVRQRLEQLRQDDKFITETRLELQALNNAKASQAAVEEDEEAIELAIKNARMQQELEMAQMQKQLLEEEMKAKHLQENLQAQQTLTEAKDLLDSIQREKEQLDQQAYENEITRQTLEEAQRMLAEAKLTKEQSEQLLKEPNDNGLSFISINPAYKDLTSAAYEEIPLTVEEAKDPFIKTLTTQERMEFYTNFLQPENQKIPSYVVGEENIDFFDIIVIYIGSFTGKISFELISKILEYSDSI